MSDVTNCEAFSTIFKHDCSTCESDKIKASKIRCIETGCTVNECDFIVDEKKDDGHDDENDETSGTKTMKNTLTLTITLTAIVNAFLLLVTQYMQD